MADPYASLRATATRLIASKGVGCTWQKPATRAVGGDPWNPSDAAPPVPGATFVRPMVWFPPGASTQKSLQALLGIEVPSSFEYGLMAGLSGFTPQITDVLIRAGAALPVVKIDTIAPDNGVPVLHTVWVQR